MTFENLKAGDKVTRVLGQKVRMQMIVREIRENILVCDCIDKDTGKIVPGGWEFDRKTGVEEDEDLKWGVKFGATGSVLVREDA